jgi:hypothetical protein
MHPQISLNELYRMRKQKETNKKMCYDKVLERCHGRIRTAAQYGGMNTFYEIPGMIVGLPLYNIQTCTEYVITKLRETGFLVQLLPPPSMYVLYISWDPEEIRPMKKSHPTLQPPSGGPPNKLRLF